MNAAQSGGHAGGGSVGKKGSQMEVSIYVYLMQIVFTINGIFIILQILGTGGHC